MDKKAINMFNDSWIAQAIKASLNAVRKGDWYNDEEDHTRIQRIRLDLITVRNNTFKGKVIDERLPDFTLVETGLAKTVIEIMIYGQAKGLNIGRAVEEIIECDAKEIESGKS